MAEFSFEELTSSPASQQEVVEYRQEEGGWGFNDETWSTFYRRFPEHAPKFKSRKEAQKGCDKYIKAFLM